MYLCEVDEHRKAANPIIVAKWHIELTTSDLGFRWAGADVWVRAQAEAIAKHFGIISVGITRL